MHVDVADGEEEELCTAGRESDLNVTVAGMVGIVNLLCVCYTISKGLEEQLSADSPEMQRSFTVRQLSSVAENPCQKIHALRLVHRV